MRATLIPWLVPLWMSSGVQVCEQPVHEIMCCIVCTSPHMHKVSVLSSSPHFIRLSFVRPIPVLSLFSVRQTGHVSLWPDGSDSFGTQLEVLLISFLHLVVLSTSGFVDEMAFVWFIKLFLDLRRGRCGVIPYIGCRGSAVIFVLSQSACVDLLIGGGAIPESIYNCSTDVFFRQPVMSRQDSFSATSTFLVCDDLPHTGLAYSPAEKHKANAVVLRTWGLQPHVEPLSFCNMPFLVIILCLVFSQWNL